MKYFGKALLKGEILMKLFFYRVNDPYGCFSNFAPYCFELNSKTWKTSEHYFQAQKFAGSEYEEEIRQLDTAMRAAKKGRDRRLPLRSDWEEIKDRTMYEAVYAKFSQNPEIADILLETGSNELIEKTTTDYYWGCGSNLMGKNMLGKILMQVRDQLRVTKEDTKD